jgi:hypothetical protein
MSHLNRMSQPLNGDVFFRLEMISHELPAFLFPFSGTV